MTFKYKTGDVVRLTGPMADEFGYDAKDKFRVIDVGHRIGGGPWLNYLIESLVDGDTHYVRSQWLTPCTGCNSDRKASNNNFSDEGESPVGVLTKVRDLARSKEDRLFRKYGVVDECGDVTPEGKELLIDLLFADHKDDLVAKLEEIESENKKSK